MAKPLLNFKKMSEANFCGLALGVITAMQENEAMFPNCDPSVAHLENTYRRLCQAIADATHRDMLKVELKNQLLAQMKAELHLLCLYVSKISKGERGIILNSGFDCSKVPSAVGVAAQARNLRVTPLINNPGSAKFKINVWEKAKAYLFEYRKVGDPLWTKVFSSKSTYVCTGLESFVAYEVRAAYIVSDPTLVYSDIVTFHVL